MIFEQHPLSAAFPAMAPDEFQELKDSIENIGVQNPITLADGMVLDGWNRYQACIELGMACPTVELPAETDRRDFVLAQNKARRHVTKAQLAMATTAVYAWAPEGKPKLHTECAVKTTSEMAEIAGVHRNTIVQAQTVTAQATAAVVDAVRRGELGLPKAAAIAKLPPEQQAAAIAKLPPEQQAAAIAKPAPKPVVVVSPPKSSALDGENDLALPEGMTEDDFAPSEEEIAEAQAHELAEKVRREALEKALQADDQTAHLLAEVQRLALLVESLNRRNNSLLDEKADAIRWAKKFEAHNRRLLKELDELKGGSR